MDNISEVAAVQPLNFKILGDSKYWFVMPLILHITPFCAFFAQKSPIIINSTTKKFRLTSNTIRLELD
ncbi:hypothetical protein EYC84_010308 [Monilinia fructicola]|uniref:Uncharacterized protein n=1 Tax=Monilinia fructicola TaxID=38448 RepID=A0A5M9JG26_MONFR|nr:hypothetical protein EYC84_010308 [Monilinia fructicola]